MCTEKAGVTVDDDMISDFHRKIGVGVGCNAFVVGIFAVGSRPDPPPHLWLIIHSGRGSKLRNTVRPERLGVAGWNGSAPLFSFSCADKLDPTKSPRAETVHIGSISAFGCRQCSKSMTTRSRLAGALFYAATHRIALHSLSRAKDTSRINSAVSAATTG